MNETWISDRNRFSYEGIYSDNRSPNRYSAASKFLGNLRWKQQPKG